MELSKKQQRREQARIRLMKQQGPKQWAGAESSEDSAEYSASSQHSHSRAHGSAHPHSSGGKRGWLQTVYEDEYKKVLLIPIILLILAIAQIGYQYASTGDFIHRGISLKGGITITIPESQGSPLILEEALKGEFPGSDLSVRVISAAGGSSGFIIDADVPQQDMERFTAAIERIANINSQQYIVEVIGSSLGESFFAQTMRALFVAFVLMGVVVFFTFGKSLSHKLISLGLGLFTAGFMLWSESAISTAIGIIIGFVCFGIFLKESIPSIAVISAAAADIIMTLAVVNLMGVKISTAGIAAFLMLIGYSIDTDILLSTRVLKRKSGTIMDAVYSSIPTGLTMTFTSMVAVFAGYLLSASSVLKEIMFIVMIGLCMDILNTWIQNVCFLRWYLEKHPEEGEIQ